MTGRIKGGSGPGICFQSKKAKNKTNEYICYEGREVSEERCLDYDFGDGANATSLFDFYSELNCDELCNNIYNQTDYNCRIFNTNPKAGLQERRVLNPYPENYRKKKI